MTSNEEILYASVFIIKDGLNAIVPVRDIEDFHPNDRNDFDKSKKYLLWLLNIENDDSEITDIFILMVGSKYTFSI